LPPRWSLLEGKPAPYLMLGPLDAALSLRGRE